MTTPPRIAPTLGALVAACLSGAAVAVQPVGAPGERAARPAPARVPAEESSIPLRAGPERAAPAAPPPGGGAPAGSSAFRQTALALGGVLSVAGAAALVLRRVTRRTGGLWSAAGPGGRSPAGILEVLGRYPLGRGQALLLLRLDRRVLLVGQSGASRLSAPSMRTLAEVVDPEEVASILTKTRDAEEERATARFTSLLRGFDAEHAAAAARAVVDVKPQRAAAPAAPTSPLRARLDALRPAAAGRGGRSG